jgi:hypothetical protein
MINTKTIIIVRRKRMSRRDRRILRRNAKYKGLDRIYFTFKTVPIDSHQNYVSTMDHFFASYLNDLYIERYRGSKSHVLVHRYGKCGNHVADVLKLSGYMIRSTFGI